LLGVVHCPYARGKLRELALRTLLVAAATGLHPVPATVMASWLEPCLANGHIRSVRMIDLDTESDDGCPWTRQNPHCVRVQEILDGVAP
jgi:hypothetical protein